MMVSQNSPTLPIRKALIMFKTMQGAKCVKPHMLISGPSGGGKSYSIQTLCTELELNLIQINTPMLVKRGLTVDVLLQPALRRPHEHWVVFIDEFDKQLLSGSTDTMVSEVLTLLETGSALEAPQYGDYNQSNVPNMLFVFGGAFDNKEVTYFDLLNMGVPREFLGRVTQHVHLPIPTNEEIIASIRTNRDLLNATKIHFNQSKDKCLFNAKSLKELREGVESEIIKFLETNDNPLGFRIINKITYDLLLQGEINASYKRLNRRLASPNRQL